MPGERHIPIRTCIGCGAKRPKGEMLRIVGTADGSARIDELGQMPGRGCYVCPNPHILDEMKISDKIGKALKLEKVVPADFVEYLQARAKPQYHSVGH